MRKVLADLGGEEAKKQALLRNDSLRLAWRNQERLLSELLAASQPSSTPC